jgi:hypothetical protein
MTGRRRELKSAEVKQKTNNTKQCASVVKEAKILRRP